ncbi:transcriptional regulator [Cellulomonas chitinilytica]|uniref:Transcriptional regulator n=1 Tax=Cellulomonas chitinilytica TaxID=398759 RepID=A0A919P4R5_9CELL|nr:helix-turn-helix domain-containing protein [Cellulomonas chitinilytica]GIG21349.1 transcriptional regulator [Cellulomonas chitinilytica]
MSAEQHVRSPYEGSCHDGRADEGKAIREVLDRIADKWSLLVIATLQDGSLRFTELQRHIPGVSQRMLTLTLRHLERDGLVTRTVHAEVPPRVEYALTPMGETLIAPSLAFATWAIAHYPGIEAARAQFDAR